MKRNPIGRPIGRPATAPQSSDDSLLPAELLAELEELKDGLGKITPRQLTALNLLRDELSEIVEARDPKALDDMYARLLLFLQKLKEERSSLKKTLQDS